MITDLDNLVKSFLLPHRSLEKRLTAAALDTDTGDRPTRSFDNAKWYAEYKADYLRDARRVGARFPDGEDATTFITRRYKLNRQLMCVFDRCDDFLPIKNIWTFLKCVTRGVDPKLTRHVMGDISEKLIMMGSVSAVDCMECPDTFHGILQCAVGYVRRGRTVESVLPFHFE